MSCSTDESVTSTTTVASSAATVVDQPATDWLADLDALDAGVRRIHPNPFWRVSEAEWNSRLAEARVMLPTLDKRHAEFLMLELTSLIDGHSGIYPNTLGYRLYAVWLYHFSDGYFVIDAADASAVGGKLVAINGVPVDEIARRLSPVVPHDNDQTVQFLLPMYMITPELLQGADIITDLEKPTLDIVRVDGSHLALNPDILDFNEYPLRFKAFPVGLPQAAVPLSQSRIDEAFWWTTIDDVLYFQYNQVRKSSGGQSLISVAADLRERLKVGDVRRVVVDMRQNSGGNNQSYGPLLRLLLDPLVDRPGGLYIIIGRQTFSAATNFVTELDVQSTSAVFVGEPTGGRPNLYGDTKPLLLPSSGITVQVSGRYWEFGGPNDTRSSIAPDIPIGLSSVDYFAGIDPILQAAISD